MGEFDDYVSDYDLSNYDISYKYEHSYRVYNNSKTIAFLLNLNDEDTYLAGIIGLLHDIGRFKQLEVYGTYNDSKSIDHGDYGCEVLFEDNVIDKFKIDSKYYNIIHKAIKNHNKVCIEDGLNNQELLHAKIIRDADKIDIYNAFTDLNAYDISSGLSDVTPKVEELFFKKEQINIKYMQTRSDYLLIVLGFVFDINFKESLKIVKDRKYIDKLYKKIEEKNKYKRYFDFVNNYIEERID